MNLKNNAVVIEPNNIHRSSVIWLHGLGADGYDFQPVISGFKLPESHGIRFIFPHAPKRAITINDGMVMRAWYDVKHPDLMQEEDIDSINESAAILNKYIDQEIEEGIPSEKIVIAGFSQGGAIALHAGLHCSLKLCGLLALSTYLPIADRFALKQDNVNSQTPIMMLHGKFDPVIPIHQGQSSRDMLQNAGYSISWHEYPMQHAVCSQEIDDISEWLQERLLQ
jgi:phospholipase/carboxylesterase